MRHSSALLCVSLLALVVSSRSVDAHHGGAAYDLTSSITLEATITRFDWANPHALISFAAPGDGGTADAWTAETAGPVILTRAGWTKTTLRSGDRVTIVGQPARNGSKTMLLQRVVFMDGRTLTSFIPRFSGVWQIDEPRASFSSDAPPPMTPWAAARVAANRATVGPQAALDANDPTLECVPPGVPYILVVPTPFELVELPTQIVQLFEYSHFVRRIHLDGRTHPVDLKDAGTHEWLGHSIGRREGATLVVDTVGFNDVTWLDRLGRPHSDALHVVERITPIDGETLDYRVTVNDPKAYLSPWSGRLTFKRRDGWEIMEHTCVSVEAEQYREYRERAWKKK